MHYIIVFGYVVRMPTAVTIAGLFMATMVSLPAAITTTVMHLALLLKSTYPRSHLKL